MSDLIAWKESSGRKPLILNGARQVGKTWLLRGFGAQQFENVAYVNFDNNEYLIEQFDHGYDTDRLLLALQAKARQPITPGKTLVILDEIQECPKAITSLKYFCENARGIAVAAAGSLLGLAVHSGTGFPVGKVNMLDLHPMSFGEFLDAKGERYLREIVDAGDWQLIGSFASKLEGYLREYYFVGGMPEVVKSHIENADLGQTRAIGAVADCHTTAPAPVCVRGTFLSTHIRGVLDFGHLRTCPKSSPYLSVSVVKCPKSTSRKARI